MTVFVHIAMSYNYDLIHPKFDYHCKIHDYNNDYYLSMNTSIYS